MGNNRAGPKTTGQSALPFWPSKNPVFVSVFDKEISTVAVARDLGLYLEQSILLQLTPIKTVLVFLIIIVVGSCTE